MADTSQTQNLTESAAELANRARELADQAATMAMEAGGAVSAAADTHTDYFFISGLSIFVLACFVGYYVVWRVTPALHSPLMGVTNAISSVVIVGALIAAGPADFTVSNALGLLAITLASINIFGGFVVTRRMLGMFKKKETKAS